MNNRQRWAIIRATTMDPETKQAQAAEKAALKMAEKAAKDAAKNAEKERKKAEREAEREAKRVAKEAAKAANAARTPKPRGRPRKEAAPLTEVGPATDMPAYDKAELIRTLAEEVYQELGAGHLESVYHKAMEVQLRLAHLPYETERVMDLKFKDHFVGVVRADIILAKECVLEFKISGKMDDAVQQARQYMKLQGIAYGFVVMFPKTDGGAVQMVDARLPSALDI